MLLFAYTFFAFVFVMKIKHKTKKGAWQRNLGMALFGWPFIVFLDWPLNMASTIIFWDKPGTWSELFTGRMKRYKKLDPNACKMNRFRYEAAHLICPMLNQHDKGHC